VRAAEPAEADQPDADALPRGSAGRPRGALPHGLAHFASGASSCRSSSCVS
jgi:hypothetical protein